jgi:hypothetical protein
LTGGAPGILLFAIAFPLDQELKFLAALAMIAESFNREVFLIIKDLRDRWSLISRSIRKVLRSICIGFEVGDVYNRVDPDGLWEIQSISYSGDHLRDPERTVVARQELLPSIGCFRKVEISSRKPNLITNTEFKIPSGFVGIMGLSALSGLKSLSSMLYVRSQSGCKCLYRLRSNVLDWFAMHCKRGDWVLPIGEEEGRIAGACID